MTWPSDAVHRPQVNQVLILGSGTIADELSLSFRRLGLQTRTGTLETAYALRDIPMLTVVCDFATPTELNDFVKATGTELVPSVDACCMTRNREGIRRTAAEELGLPTMEYEFAGSLDELRESAIRVGFPCVVKPGRSTGGEGQSFVQGAEELENAWAKAHVPESDGRVTVERYVNFDMECTIITARSIDPATGQLSTWFCEPIGTRHENGRLVEAWQPAPLSESAMDNARSIAARISGAIGGQGTYAIDLFVEGDEVYFSQVSPHPTLEAMITGATQRVSAFDLHARAVLGLPIDATLTSPGAARFLPASKFSPSTLVDVLSIPESGVTVADDIGVIRVTADTVDEARQRAEEALRYCRVT
ncbi:ATP-grasp domain-containing protein [Corynebacterium mayonis]|uniref:ATP-grasp domain-containing protein n=1 Tax=Corynebacterium mayonis TaxID=3062461 RepID=UPI003140BB7F